MELNKIQNRNWSIQACSAKKDKGILIIIIIFNFEHFKNQHSHIKIGIKEGMQWFVETISKNK